MAQSWSTQAASRILFFPHPRVLLLTASCHTELQNGETTHLQNCKINIRPYQNTSNSKARRQACWTTGTTSASRRSYHNSEGEEKISHFLPVTVHPLVHEEMLSFVPYFHWRSILTMEYWLCLLIFGYHNGFYDQKVLTPEKYFQPNLRDRYRQLKKNLIKSELNFYISDTFSVTNLSYSLIAHKK